MYWKDGAQPRWGNEDLQPKYPKFEKPLDAEAVEALSDVDGAIGVPHLDKMMVDTYLMLLKSYKTATSPDERVDGYAAVILGISKAAVACFIPMIDGEIGLNSRSIGEHIEMLARNITNTITRQVQMMRAEAEFGQEAPFSDVDEAFDEMDEDEMFDEGWDTEWDPEEDEDA